MELTSEQRALRDAVISVLRRHQPGPGEADSSYDPGLWRLLGEIGAPGLAIPERFGGAGAGPVETNIVAEELGKVLAPTPLLGSAVLAAQAILGSGDPDACERLLPGIAAGTTIAALAWTGEAGGWHPDEAACHATSRSGGGWTLAGTAHYVLDGDVADLLIVAARMPAGGISLFDVEPDQPGVDRSESPTVDQARRLAVVRLAAAANHRMAQAGQPALARARDLACIALSAEQAGAAAPAHSS